jgi:zinc transporter, ZIP family
MNAAMVILIAGAASIGSMLGDFIALRHKPTTLFMSSSSGSRAACCWQPSASRWFRKRSRKALYACGRRLHRWLRARVCARSPIHRGKVAGPDSQQRPRVERCHHRRRPRGTDVTVLAAGTSVEELIEGLSIGVGASIDPSAGVFIAAAIAIDNLSESLSISLLGDAAHRRAANHDAACRPDARPSPWLKGNDSQRVTFMTSSPRRRRQGRTDRCFVQSRRQ